MNNFAFDLIALLLYFKGVSVLLVYNGFLSLGFVDFN